MKKISLVFLVVLPLISFYVAADKRGDREREKLLKENRQRHVNSQEYNATQSRIERGERKREKATKSK